MQQCVDVVAVDDGDEVVVMLLLWHDRDHDHDDRRESWDSVDGESNRMGHTMRVEVVVDELGEGWEGCLEESKSFQHAKLRADFHRMQHTTYVG